MTDKMDARWMRFNMNHAVKVKLTEYGLSILRANNDKLNDETEGAFGPFKPPKTDQEGYTEYQLWVLMSEFGQKLWNGCNPPFETEILLKLERPTND